MYVNEDEKVNWLRKLGFTVNLETLNMAYPVCNGDVEYEDQTVWTVRKNEQDYHKPGGYNFKREDWLNAVFDHCVTVILSFCYWESNVQIERELGYL